MSVEMFLKIPGVEGEAMASGHEKEIDVLSFSWGASNPTGVKHGGGSGVGRADISSISIQKYLDKSSTSLFVACCSGKHYDTAQVSCREAGGDAPVEYWKLELSQVFVDSLAWGSSSGESKPSETLTLSFAKVKSTFTPQDKTGKGGSPIVGGWDLQTNKKL
jgi:type VI secretion system secreted protein Hcp